MGDELMTGAQRSYLKTLCEEADEPMDETLTKAQASEQIADLQQQTGRGRGARASEERTHMTPEAFTQQWAQIRQHLRGWWGHLTEQDLDHIAGQQDRLVRVIQERYQHLHEDARAEVDRRLQAYQSTGGQMAEALIAAADEAAPRLTETAETARVGAAGAPPPHPDAGGLVALVRRHPVASVLIGLGMGVLLARSLGRTRPT